MAYRLFEIHTVVGDDSNLQQKAFDRTATLTQVNDLEVAAPTIRVAPADADTQIVLGTISQGYSIAVYSDYPVKVRFNGNTATQFTLTSNNVAATNVGAPLPAECFIGGTFLVSSLYVAPITSAAQTANVWIVCTGDPANAYT